MSAQTCIVIGGRYGDVVNILPIARDIALKEGKCAVMVSEEFASVLEGCSYVEAIIISSHFTDIVPAIEQARRMFARVLVAKVSEKSVGITTQCEAFNQEAWRQCGYLNDWFRLPLVFDRRDRTREAKLIKEWDVKPRTMLVNFSGKSAPFEHGDEIKRMCNGWNVVDVGSIRAKRIYDMIGLMDAADLLITGDTSTLHLAAASGIPVINLIGDKPTSWHGSRPRNNSLIQIRYSESRSRMVGMEEMIASISAKDWRPRTWHVWSDYEMAGDTLRRHKLAKLSWEKTSWIPFPVRENRRVINDPMRSLPFIKDLVNAAVQCAGPRDVIVLTNADTCVAECAERRIAEAVKEQGAAYSFRRDFMQLQQLPSIEQIRNAKQYEGCDLFAFTVAWWEKHGRLLPDLLLASEMWDWCFRTLMHSAGGVQFNDLIAHEKHPNTWEVPDYRNTLPSQMHNKRLALPFLAAHGVAFQ